MQSELVSVIRETDFIFKPKNGRLAENIIKKFNYIISGILSKAE